MNNRDWMMSVLRVQGWTSAEFKQMDDEDLEAELPTGWCGTASHPTTDHTQTPSCIAFKAKS